MSARIESPGGYFHKPVKNLGWLLRNWKLIQNDPREGTAFLVFRRENHGACLRARLRDGRQYVVEFADAGILWKFLHRPVFYGLTVQWHLGGVLEIRKSTETNGWTYPSPYTPLRNSHLFPQDS